MDLHHLRAVAALAEQLHFGRAARALHISQPALSKQLKQIEDELGGALFVRGRSGVAPTALGRQFADDARAILRDADQALARARRIARGEGGVLRLGFGVATAALVARVVVRFRQRAPDVHIELQDMSTPAQLEALRSGALDLGFVRLPAPPDLASLAVVRDRLVAVVPRGRAAALEAAGLRALADEPFVLIPRAVSLSFNDHVLRVCAHLGFRPRMTQEARDFSTVLALVEAGVGVSLVPATAVKGRSTRVAQLRLPAAEALWRVGAVWRRDQTSPALAAFRALIEADLARRPERER
ncbi:LysR substrate-binding domain-containing protein [Sorangium sp. So ce131]|uniref:LysR family transcriptional regulator n=1 Tax=Sorangium sp. So ce131 TaxID=3133282 RepID=UPI003F62B1EC